MMKCNITNRTRLIEDYLSGKLSEEEAEAFTEHYFNCDICFKELRVREEMADLIAEEGDEIFADYLKSKESHHPAYIKALWNRVSRSRWKWFLAPAAAVVLLLPLLLITPFFRPGGGNFKTSPNLEDVIKYHETRGFSNIRIISPQNGVEVKDQILFQWETGYRGEINWSLLNHNDDILYSETININRYLFDNVAEKLSPGVYYWKLTGKDLLYVGKFQVPE